MSDASSASDEVLVEHLRRAFIRELGVTKVDVWRGKDGLHSCSAVELAEIAVRALRPLVSDEATSERVHALAADGLLAPPLAPLDPHDW